MGPYLPPLEPANLHRPRAFGAVEEGMPSEKPRIESKLFARVVAERRNASAEVTPSDARELLAAIRRLSAADEPAARASR